MVAQNTVGKCKGKNVFFCEEKIYQIFGGCQCKQIFDRIKYSISDLYRNNPGSGKSLQRASNLQQGKSELRCMPKLYKALISILFDVLDIELEC